jgi:hypothetical protein
MPTPERGQAMAGEGLIMLTGLWKKESKDGKVFYSGRLGYGASLLLFRNDQKRGDRDPDLIVYVAKGNRKEKPEAESSQPEDESEAPF